MAGLMPRAESLAHGSFFDRPILNSPYAYPGRHWELDGDGQPTGLLVETRREVKSKSQFDEMISRAGDLSPADSA